MEELYEIILQALQLLRGYRQYCVEENLQFGMWKADNKIVVLEAVLFLIESRK